MYYQAFPEWERFSWWSMMFMSMRKRLKIHAIYDQDTFVGMTIYFVSDKTVYLAYLAIDPNLRGHGYGSKILQLLEHKYQDKQIVLDIEPLNPDADNYRQRVSRLKFYQKNGWRRTHQMLKDQDGQFEALVDNAYFDKKDFARTLNQMSWGFYQFKIEK
ncbi:GNAT family N-acetyltransferase [Lactobacillus hominis]|nr:GNAT family N-acetyltransferase [Lactobacillus hominis]KRM84791.1 acetyltransferase [Lactobacillus hominis DSM 23910 = CRBIP 24.179]MCT3347827.1 N-acetyltransferase [Lactobacillus hominis]